MYEARSPGGSGSGPTPRVYLDAPAHALRLARTMD